MSRHSANLLTSEGQRLSGGRCYETGSITMKYCSLGKLKSSGNYHGRNAGRYLFPERKLAIAAYRNGIKSRTAGLINPKVRDGKRFIKTHRVIAEIARSEPVSEAESPSEDYVKLKLVGFGSRGAAALQRLLSSSPSCKRQCFDTKDVWYVDSDKSSIDGLKTYAKGIFVSSESGTITNPILDEDSLEKLVGHRASDSDGKGNINAGDGGVAFVLSSAAGISGGSGALLQVVSSLRRAGYFTVAAVTAPFEFEGAAKARLASETINKLEEAAHLVAVMEQDVLMQAFGDSQLTVSEATDIADVALEHTVRSVLQAVQAQEILKSSNGALMWHGRDLRHFKRLLAPPLQQLLTCPGTAVLGRGLATLPTDSMKEMGFSKALMHLASDAVIAASESPFLDGALEHASAVLCCLSLPGNEERHSTRMATQAAAGALRSITGRSCDDFVLCTDTQDSNDPAAKWDESGNTSISVEATLLVLRSPMLKERQKLPDNNTEEATGTRSRKSNNAMSNSSNLGNSPQRLPSSTWGMMSAMAGGTPRRYSQKQEKEITEYKPRQNSNENINDINENLVDSTKEMQASKYDSLKSGASAVFSNSSAGENIRTVRTEDTSVTESRTDKTSLESKNKTRSDPDSGQERVTVGDYLAASLTAQSLDLPPAAARWRQGQRADRLKQRRLIVWEVDELEPWQEEEENDTGSIVKSFLLGGRKTKREKKVNIKDRVAGVLMQDREDAWEADQQN